MVLVKEKKTGQRRYLLQRAKKFLSLKVRTLFYNSLIQPILDTGQLTNKRHEQDVIRLRNVLEESWTKYWTFQRDLYLQNVLPCHLIRGWSAYRVSISG